MLLLKSASRYLVMTDLDILLREYAIFEEKVGIAMTGRCVANCCVCTRVCCREELCRETVESPFLCLLRQKFPQEIQDENIPDDHVVSGC